MLTPIKKQGDEHLSVWLIICVTDCRIADWTGLALLSICSLVRKTTQDKRDYEEQERERSVSEDWCKTKIGVKRMQESRRNEVSADEWSESKVVGKANVGANQKSSERQMWERNKSRRKRSKCGSETKVVRKANVGGKQKWGETVRKVKHSSVRIENPITALYRGTEYFSLARTFRTTWGGSKNNRGQKKQKRPTQKGQPHSIYVLRAK